MAIVTTPTDAPIGPQVSRGFQVSEVHLDVENPRLPEDVKNASEAAVLRYLYDHDELEELARSMVDNGYFVQEPILVSHDATHGLIALEGNRRLATLKILLDDPIAEGIRFDDLDLGLEQRERLREVPCVEVGGREEVVAYLGFRHIEGPRPWSSEAKARFVVGAVDRAAASGSSNPFYQVGRQIGSNTQGVRNLYAALKILRVGRQDLGLASEVRPVLEARFGVWQRCLNSPEFRSFINYSDAVDFDEVQTSLRALKKEPLAEVLGDLHPKTGLLKDSRDITEYGKALMHPIAHERLRETGSLEEARRLLRVEGLPQRIADIQRQCEQLQRELVSLPAVEKDVRGAVSRLRRVVNALWASLKEDDE